MKNYNVYYLIIVFLVIMIFIPPLLRFAIPKQNPVSSSNQTLKSDSPTTNNKTEQKPSDIVNLICKMSDPEITITTTYKSDTIQKIIFSSKLLVEDTESDNSIITNILNFKSIDKSVFSNNTLSFDFSNNDFFGESLLENYSRKKEVQQSYYEQIGFTCNVTNG